MRSAVRITCWLSFLVLVSCHESGITTTRLPVAAVSIRSPAESLYVGDSTRVGVTVRAPDGEMLTDRPVAWSSSAPFSVPVGISGAVRMLDAGRAWIIAECEGLRDSVQLRGIARVSRVRISPRTATVLSGLGAGFSASLSDVFGNTLSGRPITWQSSAPTIALAGPLGGVIGVRPGTATIIATSEGHADTVIVTVLPRVTSITLTGPPDTLVPGTPWQFTAVARDSFGTIVTGRAFRWTNGDPRVGAVDSTGLVSTWGIGSMTIAAEIDGITGTGRVVTGRVRFTGIESAGPVTGCYLSANGVFCFAFGNNTLFGNPNVSSIPVSLNQTFGIVHASVPDTVRAIGKLGFQACAITTADVAYCWLGGVFPPAAVPSIAFATIGSGQGHTCGVSRSGAGWCWGSNGNGQLGNGTATSSSPPVQVSAPTTMMAIDPGSIFTCGLGTDSLAYCWGDNFAGRLGIGTTAVQQRTPTAVARGIHFASISAGGLGACGLTAAGAAWCWGSNSVGQLGTDSLAAGSVVTPPCTIGGGSACTLAPLPVSGGITFAQLRLSFDVTCGLATDQTIWCWGTRLNAAPRTRPVQLSTTLKFTSLSLNGHTACAMATDGRAYCWDPTSTETPLPSPGQN